MGSGGEIWLPEPAIERIQYFLNSKKAAQTTIISKSWYNVWSIRPNLDFDHEHHLACYSHDPRYPERMERFLAFADYTLNRYEESNLKIDSFKLRTLYDHDEKIEHPKLIVRALKIGATPFTLRLKYCSGFDLPDEVFESAENLTLIRCDINRKPIVTRSSRLQSLSLYGLVFKNPDMISHILLSCPLIQNLSLYGVSTVKPVDYYNDYNGGYYDKYQTHDNGYITKPLMWLTTLVLKYVHFDMLFLGDLSSKFPLLKDLTIFMGLKKHQEEILISSTSLVRLYFRLKNNNACIWWPNRPYKRQRVTLDFPSIRKFIYMGSVIPLLSIESDSSGWESHLSISRRHKFLTASWFRRLSDLLTKLRPSRISLLLHFRFVKSFNYEAGDIQGLPTNEIENLIIDYKDLSSLACYALLDVLFQMCHPKWITQCVSTCFRVKKKLIEQLGQIILNGLVLNHENTMLTRSHFMYGLIDLKEAKAQIIDKSSVISSRRDVPLDVLLEHLKSAKGKQEVRFHLNWQTTTTLEKFYMKMSNHQKIEEFDNELVLNPNNERRFSVIKYAIEHYVVTMSKKILENSGSGELVLRKVKHFLKLIRHGFPESDNVDDANKFSCMLYEVFREPCFVNAVRAAIEESGINLHVVNHSRNYPHTERVARMKADWCFEHTLISSRFHTTNFNTISVLLSIIFGHWSDEAELRELDKRILGETFGSVFDIKATHARLCREKNGHLPKQI